MVQEEQMKIIMGIARDVAAINEKLNSAHKRIDELKGEIEKIKEGQNWLPKLIASSFFTTVVGGIVGYSIAIMLKEVGV